MIEKLIQLLKEPSKLINENKETKERRKKALEANKRWRENNPEKAREYHNNCRDNEIYCQKVRECSQRW